MENHYAERIIVLPTQACCNIMVWCDMMRKSIFFPRRKVKLIFNLLVEPEVELSHVEIAVRVYKYFAGERDLYLLIIFLYFTVQI